MHSPSNKYQVWIFSVLIFANHLKKNYYQYFKNYFNKSKDAMKQAFPRYSNHIKYNKGNKHSSKYVMNLGIKTFNKIFANQIHLKNAP